MKHSSELPPYLPLHISVGGMGFCYWWDFSETLDPWHFPITIPKQTPHLELKWKHLSAPLNRRATKSVKNKSVKWEKLNKTE